MATVGVPQGSVEDLPVEGALAVPGRHSAEHVAQGGYPPVDVMVGPGPNSKGDHQHTRYRPVRDPVEGDGPLQGGLQLIPGVRLPLPLFEVFRAEVGMSTRPVWE